MLINSNEQMLVEKLRSLLKFGTNSTRFKDVFDIFYLSQHVELTKLKRCMDAYIISDRRMHENNEQDVLSRVRRIFADKRYLKQMDESGKNWLDIPVKEVVEGVIEFFENL